MRETAICGTILLCKGEIVMGQELPLVGGVPLKTVEDVVRTLGETLGRYLLAMPDGEVIDRLTRSLKASRRPPSSNARSGTRART
jgi:hypothetical protein